MVRPKKSPEDRRTEKVQLHLDAGTKAKLEAAAAERDREPGELARIIVERALREGLPGEVAR